MNNPKAEVVQQTITTTVSGIRGTEAGHVYSVVRENGYAIVGIRALDKQFSTEFSDKGTRIRVVPKDPALARLFYGALAPLGYGNQKGSASAPHFSVVTSDRDVLQNTLNALGF